DLMAEDLQLVIQLLKQKYGEQTKVFALGHSWGVILGTYYLISQENELQGAIFSNGSHSSEHETSARMDYIRGFADEMIAEGLSIPETIETEMGTFTHLEEVVQWCTANDPIETYPQLRTQYDLVGAVRGYVQETYVQDSIDIAMSISSRDINYYSHFNPLTAQINKLRTGQLLNDTRPGKENSIQEFYDFTPQMDQITLPVALIFGRYDDIIGPEVAEDYYQVIATPETNKELHFLERSGHSGLFRENRRFSELLIDFVEKHR
ncbi:MAG: alpha/beta hydrolase, partial [Bacteroidota bacterium]